MKKTIAFVQASLLALALAALGCASAGGGDAPNADPQAASDPASGSPDVDVMAAEVDSAGPGDECTFCYACPTNGFEICTGGPSGPASATCRNNCNLDCQVEVICI